jgi:hypothetical protein
MDSDTLLAEEDLLKPDPASLRSKDCFFCRTQSSQDLAFWSFCSRFLISVAACCALNGVWPCILILMFYGKHSPFVLGNCGASSGKKKACKNW